MISAGDSTFDDYGDHCFEFSLPEGFHQTAATWAILLQRDGKRRAEDLRRPVLTSVSHTSPVKFYGNFLVFAECAGRLDIETVYRRRKSRKFAAHLRLKPTNVVCGLFQRR